MAKLDRVTAKVFAASAAADEIGQFGSAVAGAKLETADVATIQGLSAWLSGWSEALVSGNRYPALQEMNGLLKVLSYQGAYALQEGIPEYDANTTYYIGSIVKKTGTFEIYGSLTDNNLGNALTVGANWKLLVDLNTVGQNITQIGTCSTASATAEKAVVLSGFVLTTGATIQITFTNANTATTPTLNVNATGAKAIKNIIGDTLTYIPATTEISFIYDGTNWVCQNAVVGYIFPDYAKGITKTWNTTYIAECDGWVEAYCVNEQVTSITTNRVINGVTKICHYNSANAQGSALLTYPINKGDTYSFNGGTSAAETITFYPVKGAN